MLVNFRTKTKPRENEENIGRCRVCAFYSPLQEWFIILKVICIASLQCTKTIIKYPQTLTNEQEELLKKLQDSFGLESKPHESNFEGMFEKVKKWFS